MSEAFLVSHVVLWLLVLVLAAVVVALARQVGVLHERVAPAGALMTGGGPAVGAPVHAFELETLAGAPLALGSEGAEKSTLLFFLSPSCPVCDALIPTLRSIQRHEDGWLRVVLASDGEADEHRRFVARKGLEGFPYVLSTPLGIHYQVAKLPYAALIDDRGILRAKGLVNTREHLESLFEAMERGVASIAEYVEAEGKDADRGIRVA